MSDTSVFDELPGDLMIWVLIVSELLVFGAGLAAFLAVRITDPAGFATAQDALYRTGAGINTVVLITSVPPAPSPLSPCVRANAPGAAWRVLRCSVRPCLAWCF